MTNAGSTRDQRRTHTRELVSELATADPECRDGIVEKLTLTNLDVARAIARRYTGRSGLGPDLEQVAFLALVKAARDFDATRGHAFLAYAVPCIVGAVKHYYRDSAWAVKPPRGVQKEHGAWQGLSQHVAHGVEIQTCFRPWSLDVPRPGDVAPLGAELADPDDTTWERADNRLMLWQHVRELPPIARTILHHRFVEDRTQQEIADALGFSQYHVSRLLSRYLRDLRDRMVEAA
jgi:RNA polymerase sigma-B factor